MQYPAQQVVLAALASGLKTRLRNVAIDPKTREALTDIVQAEADQLRLQLDGGWCYETVRTEWGIYRALHGDAPVSHRVFKVLSLLPAFVLPPRTFYGVRRKLIYNDLYLRARARWLPIPASSHVQKESRTAS